MSPTAIQLLVLAAIAVFLVIRLRNVLGTRDGFEPRRDAQAPAPEPKKPTFDVIEGGIDPDVADHVDIDSRAGQALIQMKALEPDFMVGDFLGGARQAYEMILMAFEGDDLETLESLLSEDVYDSFKSVIDERQKNGLKVEASFIGVRELKLSDAMLDPANNEAEITIKFIGELVSAVRNEAGEVVEGDTSTIKKQKDVWTFARVMGSDDPNWRLVATGE